MHILDAFYSLENSGVSNIGITKGEEQLLLQETYDAFIKLDKRSREVMLNNLPQQFKNIEYSNGYSYYEVFNKAHTGLSY